MRKTNALLLATLVTAGLLAFATPDTARGQVPPSGPNPALAQARATVTDAKTAVADAQKDLQRIKTKVEGTFEGKAKFAKARSRMKKAKAAHDAAVKKAKADLLKSDEYKTAMAKRDAAQKKRDELNSAKAEDAELIAVTQELTETGLAVKTMEVEAVGSSEAVAAAKESMQEAQTELDGLEDELEDALRSDEEYIAAEEALEMAKAQLDQAKTALAEMVKSEAAARAAARASQRPQRAPRPGKGGY